MDVAAMNAILDAAFGVNRAAHCPASHDLGLFLGDPALGGVELDSVGGYARVAVAAADWSAAADGEKEVQVTLPTATAEWSDEATHWGLFDGTTLWTSGRFAESVVVTGAGTVSPVSVVVQWADAVTADE